MKKVLLPLAITSFFVASGTVAADRVSDETSLIAAVAAANADSSVRTIIFKKNTQIALSAPVIYTGSQPITFVGHGAVINGSAAGSFVVADDLTATTEDGTLIFNTASSVTLRNLTVENSATRGVVINIPGNATGDDVVVKLRKVSIINSALYGLHIDDNADEFDDGVAGSDVGVDLRITRSRFVGNGTGAIDFDGIRVDERAGGGIDAYLSKTQIDGNGGDGMELDEAGPGNVDVTMIDSSLKGNGFYNEADLDDGFDIDEAGEGDISAVLVNLEVAGNKDEGLDFDEEGDGDVNLKLKRVGAAGNSDEGIKVDEEDEGNIVASLKKTRVMESGDDGIQFTELGEGAIDATLRQVSAVDNAKYGIKMEQWVEEDEGLPVETAGSLAAREVALSGNGSGDEIELNNIIVD